MKCAFHGTELWGPSTEYLQHLYSEPVSMVLVCLVRAGEMAHWEEGLATKLDDLVQISGFNVVEEENQPLKTSSLCVLISTHAKIKQKIKNQYHK